MKLSTQYGNRKIEFEIEYRNRNTLAIQIEPIDKVLVLSPRGLSEEIIKEKVKLKAKWILKKLFHFKDMGYIPSNREFVNGEAFIYLGRNYLLQLLLNENLYKPIVKLSDGKLNISTPTKDRTILKNALQKWYKERSKKNNYKKTRVL